MHMISKKDLNSAELETVTTLRSPTTVFTANGEVQTNEEATVLCQRIGYILDNWKSLRIRQQFCRWESFAMNMDTHMSGSTVKNHISFKMVFEYSVIQKKCRTNRGSWFINEFFLKLALFNIHDTIKAGNWSSQVFLKLVYFNTHDSFRSGNWSFRSPSSNRVKWKCG